jgi:hypothetical protein
MNALSLGAKTVEPIDMRRDGPDESIREVELGRGGIEGLNLALAALPFST